MSFALYSQQTGGSPLWTETHANVPVSNGLFSVRLGSVNALSTNLLSGDRWLGIQVGTDPEMSPREKLAAVPYAMMAGRAETSQFAEMALFGGRPNSYPHVIGLGQFLLQQEFSCSGYVPLEGGCSLDVLNNFFRTKSLGYNASGRIGSANNSPGSPRWGYSFAFFLSNPGPAKALDIRFGSCNDVAIYTLTGAVTGDSLGENGSLVYHRTPGNGDGGAGCSCSDINPNISAPSGDLRLVILTRGGDCTSYLGWPSTVGNWITQNGLQIDWPNLRKFLGED